MPIFEDSSEPQFFVPEGDYIFCVVEYEKKYSQGAATGGSEQASFKCEVEGKNSHYFELLTIHPSCLWRVESFLRAAGIALKKGDGWSFSKAEAEEKGWRWINPVGLRGHVHLFVDTYNEKKKNKASVYYAPSSARPALPPRVIEPAKDDDIPF